MRLRARGTQRLTNQLRLALEPKCLENPQATSRERPQDGADSVKHDLKNLFKGAAAVASSKPGPFQEFYTALVAKGMRPEMARLTLARKIATIVLIVWKKGVCFDASHLKPQTA